MRRIVASVLCLLMLSSMAGSASADAADAEALIGAGSIWWRHDGSHGTLYFLDVYDTTRTHGYGPRAQRAWFGAIPCDVNRRNRPVDCKWRRADYQRVKVESFSIDPLLNAAHVVLRHNGRQGEVSWEGRGEYREPFLWQGVGELFAPPYFAHAYANVLAYIGRDARATGDLFGLGLRRSEFMDAGMADIVYANAGACLMGPFCW